MPHREAIDLRVEYGRDAARDRVQDFEILPRSVHDLHRSARGEEGEQRPEIRKGEWIDASDLRIARDLHETELRAISALAQELGIEADRFGTLEVSGELIERGRGGDDVRQRVRRRFLYNPAAIMPALRATGPLGNARP